MTGIDAGLDFSIFGAYAITVVLLMIAVRSIWGQWLTALDKIRDLEAQTRLESNENLTTLKDVSSAIKHLTHELEKNGIKYRVPGNS